MGVGCSKPTSRIDWRIGALSPRSSKDSTVVGTGWCGMRSGFTAAVYWIIHPRKSEVRSSNDEVRIVELISSFELRTSNFELSTGYTFRNAPHRICPSPAPRRQSAAVALRAHGPPFARDHPLCHQRIRAGGGPAPAVRSLLVPGFRL